MQKIEAIGNKIIKLDVFEQIVLLVFYTWFIFRLYPKIFGEARYYILLLIVSESIAVFFLMIRRPTENISKKFWDWFIAFSGTFTPFLVNKGGDPWMPLAGAVMLFWGMSIHVGAKLSLNRSLGMVPADRGVKVQGLYTIVRHPMYAGYFISHMGYLIAAPSLWNVTVYVLCWFFLVLRIFAEERIFVQSPEYQAYKSRVVYRIIPGVF